MREVVECFYPGKEFPALSVTGTSCALNCKHCARRYLESMVPVKTPSDLLAVAEALEARGAKGFLLSGGSDSNGRVPVGPFAPAIKRIKATTDLLVNCHVGLSSKEELKSLVMSGVDAFSADVYGSDETIREVLGTGARAEDYFAVIGHLKDLGAKVASHLCIGVHGGKLKGESSAIERLAKLEPETLIFISLIPTKGSAYESVAPPTKESIIEVIRMARAAMPTTSLIMGCMRSKKDRTAEYDMLEAGLDGIVMPAPRTLARLRFEGVEVRERRLCCAFAAPHL